MKDLTLKILLVLNLIVLTAIFVRPPLPVPSADAQTSDEMNKSGGALNNFQQLRKQLLKRISMIRRQDYEAAT